VSQHIAAGREVNSEVAGPGGWLDAGSEQTARRYFPNLTRRVSTSCPVRSVSDP
jgi:hypothetical protein